MCFTELYNCVNMAQGTPHTRLSRNTVPCAIFPNTLPREQGVYWIIWSLQIISCDRAISSLLPVNTKKYIPTENNKTCMDIKLQKKESKQYFCYLIRFTPPLVFRTTCSNVSLSSSLLALAFQSKFLFQLQFSRIWWTSEYYSAKRTDSPQTQS